MLNKVEGLYGGIQDHVWLSDAWRVTRGSVAAAHLKAIQVPWWGLDSFGFSLILAGQETSHDVYALHWTPQLTWSRWVCRIFYFNVSKSYIKDYAISSSFSVRCVKD
jgi:hypothetical protein